MKLFLITGSFFLLLFTTATLNAQTDSLDNYVKRLKLSKVKGGSETAFLSIGSDFLYGQEYFEAGNYSSAAGYFEGILRKEKDHPYANYQLAISLLKQHDTYKARQAEPYLENAFRLIPSLRKRYSKDIPANVEPAQKNPPAVNTTATAGNSLAVQQKQGHSLDEYIDKIKYSRSTGGAETYMNSPGLDAFYGIEYYENGDYGTAATSFSRSLAKDNSNPYVNYMNAIALAAQGKNNEAKTFLAKATSGDKTLQQRFAKEAPLANARWKKLQESRTVKTIPVKKAAYGGALVYGNYTCHLSIWNGPNASPAYRYEYKGYFALKKDGTYRWLDNGETGKYNYDAATGTITWLSGYFKGQALKLSVYQPGTTVSQITVNFSDSYRWECGCNNK
ncbi:tetratricopeptide repeat protein [Rubrolithibacter danxiaensis]|uniref:tetratricopeptide repeat protein n=1 Tax=Rubrolithibacter danxiaensis TaxID=3390805 RepID=UPI003BF84889